MNYKLIILPQPILVSMKEPIVERSNDCFYSFETSNIYSCKEFHSAISCYKIIAGIKGLPSLDLSAIAEEIGWVDVDRLALDSFDGDDIDFGIYWGGFDKGFKAAQSLNEKKYSEEDVRQLIKQAILYAARFGEDALNHEEDILRSIKPKEYNVEVEMEDKIAMDGHTLIGREPKITNNTIKVTKIL